MASKKHLTSRAAIEQVVLTEPKRKWRATEITELGFPLTNLSGKDPRHSFYMNIYKEGARPDGIVKRSQVKGKTVFTVNPKRKSTVKAEAAKETKKGSPRKRAPSSAKVAQVAAEVA